MARWIAQQIEAGGEYAAPVGGDNRQSVQLQDLNGDGVMDGYDQYGMLTENPEFFITGCGVVFSEKNDADEPELTFVNESTITALEKINLHPGSA